MIPPCVFQLIAIDGLVPYCGCGEWIGHNGTTIPEKQAAWHDHVTERRMARLDVTP